MSNSFELRQLKKNRSLPLIKAFGGRFNRIVNDQRSIIDCTLQESNAASLAVIGEASLGFGMGTISLITTIGSAATVMATSPTAPVVIATIGLVLTAMSVHTAAKPDPDSNGITQSLYHEDGLTRSSGTSNDVILLCIENPKPLELQFNRYRLNELLDGEYTISNIMGNSNTIKTTIFSFGLFIPIKIHTRRAIKIPNLIPTGVNADSSSDTSDGSNNGSGDNSIAGSLVKFSADYTEHTFYMGSDCFTSYIPTIKFEYSASESSYIMQKSSQHLAYGNRISALPTNPFYVLRLKNLMVTGSGATVNLATQLTVEATIDTNITCWAYTANRRSHGGSVTVTGYNEPGLETKLIPQDGIDTYFLIKDWVPFSAFYPA